MNVFVKGALLTAAVAVFGATSASAQNSDNDVIDVLAVVDQPINVSAGADLDFGTLLPGFARTINPDNVASGDFAITGAAGAQVALSFALPAGGNLASGGNTMPVTITAGYGADRTAVTAVNTATGGNANLDGTGNLAVFIGGTVTPAAAQAAGSYSGTVTLPV